MDTNFRSTEILITTLIEGIMSTNKEKFKGLENAFAQEIWENNYKHSSEDNFYDTIERWVETFADTFSRYDLLENADLKMYQSWDLMRLPHLKEKLAKLFYDQALVPGGRISANIGIKGRNTTLMNCFVHHPADIGMKDPDSLDSIFKLLRAQALTLKSEGGIGTNMSYLRPNGSYVQGISGRTPGVLKIAELWDKSSEIITLGSDRILGEIQPDEKKKARKGAQMLVLDVWHPEIMDFITAKQSEGILTKFNTSVGITKGFMQAVLQDELWDLVFPDTTYPKYKAQWKGDIDDWKAKGHPIIVYHTLRAKTIWNTLMEATYTRNEPGVLFLDTANEMNPLSYIEIIKASNPCGEILMPTGVCNLAHVNLVKFIRKMEKNNYLDPTIPFQEKFNFAAFAEAVECGTIFLDTINDISDAPLPEYKKSMIQKRRIGLGISGLGSLHFMMGIRYGSLDSIRLIKEIFKVKMSAELLTSAKLGNFFGSFELFERTRYFSTKWWKNIVESGLIDRKIVGRIEDINAMRNSHHSANAPTGNGSIFAGGISGGIEPVFLKQYVRWSSVSEYDEEQLRKQGYEIPKTSMKEFFETKDFHYEMRGDEKILVGEFGGEKYNIDKNRGLVKSTQQMDYGWKFIKDLDPDNLHANIKKDIFVTTDELTVTEHVDVLAAISPYVNMNSSKTVNLRNDYPFDEFKTLYEDAYLRGIKGMTTYRADTMTAVLESEKFVTKEAKIKEPTDLGDLEYGYRRRVLDASGAEVYVQMTVKNNELKEIFANLPNISGEVDGVINPKLYLEKLSLWTLSTRLISLLLRSGINISQIIKHLKRSSFSSYDLPGILTPVIEEFVALQEVGNFQGNVEGEKSNKLYIPGKVCSECKGTRISMQEGCEVCEDCGWSPCNK